MNDTVNRFHGQAPIVIFLVVIVFFFLFQGLFGGAEKPEKNSYQAVFLQNGQVYFGKLAFGDDQYVLKDVYYLQRNQSLQQGAEPAKADLQLIKLGDEIHGPTDALYIEREQILIWENLKDSGKVVTAIKAHKAQQASAALTPIPAPVAQPSAQPAQ